MWSLLPEDIVINILSCLPVRSLLRFRCVCKSLCNLISNPNFVKSHLNHAIQEHKFSVILRKETSLYSIDCENIDDNDEFVEIDYPFKSSNDCVKIMGSCNGLLCIIIYSWESDIYILNPSTKEFKFISNPLFENKSFAKIAYGFGYDFKIDDYKLVSVVSFEPYNTELNWEIEVYTLGSNTWRNVQTPIPNCYYIDGEVPGVLVNGALHWKATHRTENYVVVIFSFDIGDERIQEVPLANNLHYFHLVVCAFEGSLCVVAHTHKDFYVDVWVMKDYGVLESWTKLFTIDNGQGIHYLRPIHSFKNGEILFEAELWGSLNRLNSVLVSYNPKHGRDTRVLKRHCISRWWGAIPYVRSLVSLNSGTNVGRKQD